MQKTDIQTQLERDLIATRDLIADPKNWTQGGQGYCEEGPAWCAGVAAWWVVRALKQHNSARHDAVMVALASTLTDDEAVEAEWFNAPSVGPLRAIDIVVGFNDSRSPDVYGHAEVIAKLERAIGVEQQRQRPPKPRIRYDTEDAVAELRRKALEQVAHDEGGGAVAAVVEKV